MLNSQRFSAASSTSDGGAAAVGLWTEACERGLSKAEVVSVHTPPTASDAHVRRSITSCSENSPPASLLFLLLGFDFKRTTRSRKMPSWLEIDVVGGDSEIVWRAEQYQQLRQVR